MKQSRIYAPLWIISGFRLCIYVWKQYYLWNKNSLLSEQSWKDIHSLAICCLYLPDHKTMSWNPDNLAVFVAVNGNFRTVNGKYAVSDPCLRTVCKLKYICWQIKKSSKACGDILYRAFEKACFETESLFSPRDVSSSVVSDFCGIPSTKYMMS